jgi:predicted permease
MAQQVALIETAMPSAVLAAIYAKHYNCKPELVSTTIVVTLVLSLISVTVLFNIFY